MQLNVINTITKIVFKVTENQCLGANTASIIGEMHCYRDV